jgi:hypothetical protein
MAIMVVDYQWLMFYPCVYVFAIWDSYHDALVLCNQEGGSYVSIPFVVAAYITTIGLIYSSVSLPLIRMPLGPVFQPIIFMIVGFGVGILIRNFLRTKEKS